MNYKDIENIIEQCTLRVNNKINKKLMKDIVKSV